MCTLYIRITNNNNLFYEGTAMDANQARCFIKSSKRGSFEKLFREIDKFRISPPLHSPQKVWRYIQKELASGISYYDWNLASWRYRYSLSLFLWYGRINTITVTRFNFKSVSFELLWAVTWNTPSWFGVGHYNLVSTQNIHYYSRYKWRIQCMTRER